VLTVLTGCLIFFGLFPDSVLALIRQAVSAAI
jgi:hypothetical protein